MAALMKSDTACERLSQLLSCGSDTRESREIWIQLRDERQEETKAGFPRWYSLTARRLLFLFFRDRDSCISKRASSAWGASLSLAREETHRLWLMSADQTM